MNESGLSIILIFLLVLALQFIINYKSKNKKIDVLNDIVCIIITIALLNVGYFYDKWLFLLTIVLIMIVLEIRKLNINKE